MPRPRPVVVGLDIETAPLPTLSEIQTAHLERATAQNVAKTGSTEEDARAFSHSMNPHLAYVCAVSLAFPDGTAQTWTGGPDIEAENLWGFWDVAAKVARQNPRLLWATFNGKRFDSPFLSFRSAVHSVLPTVGPILDTYPFGGRQQERHFDAYAAFPGVFGTLAEMCDSFGIPTPKTETTGADVAGLVAEGRFEEVGAYCAGDAAAARSCVVHILRPSWAGE